MNLELGLVILGKSLLGSPLVPLVTHPSLLQVSPSRSGAAAQWVGAVRQHPCFLGLHPGLVLSGYPGSSTTQKALVS